MDRSFYRQSDSANVPEPQPSLTGPVRRLGAKHGANAFSRTGAKPYDRPKSAGQRDDSQHDQHGVQGFKTPVRLTQPSLGNQEQRQQQNASAPSSDTPRPGFLGRVSNLVSRPYSWLTSTPAPVAASSSAPSDAVSTRQIPSSAPRPREHRSSDTAAGSHTSRTFASIPSQSRTDASAAIRAVGIQRLDSHRQEGTPSRTMSVYSAAPSQASRFSGMSGSQSFAFGFGSERRLGGLGPRGPSRLSSASVIGFGGTSSSAVGSTLGSARRLQQQRPISGSSLVGSVGRSPISRRVARSSLGSSGLATGGVYAASEIGGSYATRAAFGTPSRQPAHAGSAFGPSRAGSAYRADGAAGAAPSEFGSVYSGAPSTPGRRHRQPWTSLNLHAPSSTRRMEDTEGEEMMRMYAAANAREQGTDAELEEVMGASLSSRLDSTRADAVEPTLGKRPREPSGLEDAEGEDYVWSSRKRRKQMIYDPELGFVTPEELQARRPAPPPPKNEAEAILNHLERLRTPLGDARRGLQSSPISNRILAPVPVPTPERSQRFGYVDTLGEDSGTSGSVSGVGQRSTSSLRKSIAPQTRALEKNRKAYENSPMRSAAGEGGLRAKLRDSFKASTPRASSVDNGKSIKGVIARKVNQRQFEEEEDEDEDYIPDMEEEQESSGSEMAVEEEEEAALDDALPPPKPAAQRTGLQKAVGKSEGTQQENTAAPSLRDGLRASSAAPMGRLTLSSSKDDNFTIRSDPTESSSSRSSLRVAATKTSRQHQKASGRFTADDGSDEEDSDELDEKVLKQLQASKSVTPVAIFPTSFKFADEGITSSAHIASPVSARTRSTATVTPAAVASAAPVQPPKIVFKAVAEEGWEKPTTSSAPAAVGKASDLAPSTGSLLARMGDFAEDSTPSAPAAAPASQPKPAFSFAAPAAVGQDVSAVNPTPKPIFSFAPTPATSNAVTPTFESEKKSTIPNDFFSLPSKDTSASKKDTPSSEDGAESRPNFFASSLAKLPQKEASAPAGKPMFSFGTAELSKTSAATPIFSLPKPSSSEEASETSTKKERSADDASEESKAPVQADSTSKKPAFSFANGTAAGGSEASKPPAFSFGSPSATSSLNPPASTAPSSSTPAFSFGTPAVTSASTSAAAPFPFKKPEAAPRRETNGSAATSASQPASGTPALSFGAPTSSVPLASSAAPAFSFGQPAASSASSTPTAAAGSQTPATGTTALPADLMDESPGGGAVATAAGAPPSTPSFSFGVPSSAAPTVPKPLFSFGALSATNTAPTAGTPASLPSFGGFGQAPVGAGSGAAAGTTFGIASSTTQSFTFGQPVGGSQSSGFGVTPSSQAPAKSPFGFGGNTGASKGQAPAMAQTGSNGSAGSQNAFTFGAPSSGSAPSSPAPGTAFNFNFGSTAPAFGSSSITTAAFGANGNAAPQPSQSQLAAFTFGSGTSVPGTPPGTSAGAPPAAAGTFFNMGSAPSSTPGSPRRVKGLPPRARRAG
ncbi:hypothetical protein K437DRAFT_118024 [Tilletiaria anomala UBC 951]|uniref:Uncharacterized protein n=1 Tax=Tilletiaria anomala (strain ATCC 24038 / CBS 436.72 / UBC 951) TaxID=1037660 RepID=A0A066WH62_TILAU|nr:uncharacterized protein K437DRAFT_118024 [Tilletiaria anomala UBC 951]KDN53171.1 hypothetical protein K437DRAFT_118024 [Tilletiaria anomala UBC 951]